MIFELFVAIRHEMHVFAGVLYKVLLCFDYTVKSLGIVQEVYYY